MPRMAPWIVLLLVVTCSRLVAVENVYTSTFNESAPTSSNISSWQTGWAQPTVQPTGYTSTTGWNYVGLSRGAAAVYLGNGWVITCSHVGEGNFLLNGVTYPLVANSTQNFSSNGTIYDFIVFQVSPAPALPPLPLRTTDPVVNSSHVVMIGYGDGANNTNETWGYDTLNYGVNESTSLGGYVTNDFWILNNSSSAKYQLEPGDSGGADFIYNSTSGHWELAGLNEAILTTNNGATQVGSAFVQLDTYLPQILAVITPPPQTEPTLPQWGLVLMGVLLCVVAAPQLVPRRR